MHPDLPDLAELYDLDSGGYDYDIPFYESLAQRCGGPVLELGIGTARVALPLAQARFELWGIDASEEMLERARCKAREAGASIELTHAQMQEFDVDQRFGLIYAAFGTLHHLVTDGDLARSLRCVERHLRPDGVFACDLRPLQFEDWEEGDSVPLFHDWSRALPRTGERVTKLRAVRSIEAMRLKSETVMYDIASAEGSVRRVQQEHRLRFFSREEIEARLADAELEAEGVFGGYHGEAFDEAGEHLIVIAHTLEGAE